MNEHLRLCKRKYKNANLALNLRIKRIKVLDLYQVLCYLTQSWSLVNQGFLWMISYFFWLHYFSYCTRDFPGRLIVPMILPRFLPNILILESSTFYMFVKKMINESFFLFFIFFFFLFLLTRVKVFKILTFEQKRKYFVFLLSNS